MCAIHHRVSTRGTITVRSRTRFLLTRMLGGGVAVRYTWEVKPAHPVAGDARGVEFPTALLFRAVSRGEGSVVAFAKRSPALPSERA